MTSVISLTEIMSVFAEELSVYRKGEKSFDAGKVVAATYDGSAQFVKGEVEASMKNQRYSVEIVLADGQPSSWTCTCPRGSFKCSHVAALLIYVHKNISKTDKVCSWKAPKATTHDSSSSVNQLYPQKRPFNPLDREVTDADREVLAKSLKTLNRFSGFHWLLQPEPAAPNDKWKQRTMQDILNAKSGTEEILAAMAMTPQLIEELATDTIGQRENPLWHQMRFGRLTASNFGAVISAIKRNRYPPSLFFTLLRKTNLEHVKTVQWGINHEKDAVERFERAKNVKVQQTGLWLHPSGILGASPDGIVGNDLVEVKCPFKHRLGTILDILADPNYCLERDGTLKTDHQYYDQVQGQLYLTNKSKCHVTIYTSTESMVVTVPRDPSWAGNIDLMIDFYKTMYLQKLME